MLTLSELLTSTRETVSATQYHASRMLGPSASWAVWGDRTGDVSVFDDAEVVAPRLRKDIVLIGANFGTGGDPGGFPTFKNFHAQSSRGDAKLRNGVVGSALEGALLTDLVKDYPTKYANGLPREIKAGTLDTRKHVVDGFLAEQSALGLGLDTLYTPIGARTRELWDLLVERGELPAEQRVFHRDHVDGPFFKGMPVKNLTHYAAAVNMREAVQALLRQRVRR